MIDDDLRRALDVDPSPDFLARVRRRVASGSAARPTAWSWLAIPLTAAALVAIAVVLRAPRRATEAPAPVRASFVAPAGSLTTTVGPRDDPRRFVSEEPAAREVARAAAAGAARASVEPEVLISRSESLALQRLLTGIRDGTIDPRQLPPDPPVVSEIVVPPIPIPPVLAGEGARQ